MCLLADRLDADLAPGDTGNTFPSARRSVSAGRRSEGIAGESGTIKQDYWHLSTC